MDIDRIGEIIDRACDNNDKEELILQISSIKEIIKDLKCSENKVYLYYFLANSWSGLRL